MGGAWLKAPATSLLQRLWASQGLLSSTEHVHTMLVKVDIVYIIETQGNQLQMVVKYLGHCSSQDMAPHPSQHLSLPTA